MKKNKHIPASIALIGFPIMALSCGTDSPEDENYPERSIELIVPYSPGGGTDINARELTPPLETAMGGANIQVLNLPGAGGWVGWDELLAADADGYTIGYVNSPNIFTGWLNPDMGRDVTLDDFTLIANHLTDPGVLSIHPEDDRFNDLESLIEYAQENEVTYTSTAVGGYQHTVALEMNRDHGTNFQPVHNEGAGESMSQFLGGHVDLLLNSVGQAFPTIEDGDAIPLAVFDSERSEFLEDVPTSDETMIGPITGGAVRGIGAPGDFPDELVPVLVEALEEAMSNEEHIEAMARQGLAVDFKGPEEFRTHMEEQEATLEGLVDELGWDQ